MGIARAGQPTTLIERVAHARGGTTNRRRSVVVSGRSYAVINSLCEFAILGRVACGPFLHIKSHVAWSVSCGDGWTERDAEQTAVHGPRNSILLVKREVIKMAIIYIHTYTYTYKFI